jgi:hypothetical protein
MVVAAATLGFMVFVPRPTAAKEKAATEKKILMARIAAKSAEDRATEARSVVGARTWTEGVDQITSTTIRRVNALAQQSGVVLTNLRPGRAVTTAALPILPFTANLEGPFPKVFEVVRKLEDPANRLCVTLVQFDPQDENTDGVVATIGLAAFRAPVTEEPASTPPATGGATRG